MLVQTLLWDTDAIGRLMETLLWDSRWPLWEFLRVLWYTESLTPHSVGICRLSSLFLLLSLSKPSRWRFWAPSLWSDPHWIKLNPPLQNFDLPMGSLPPRVSFQVFDSQNGSNYFAAKETDGRYAFRRSYLRLAWSQWSWPDSTSPSSLFVDASMANVQNLWSGIDIDIGFVCCPLPCFVLEIQDAQKTCTNMHSHSAGIKQNDAQRARAVRFKSSHFLRDMPCSTYSGGAVRRRFRAQYDMLCIASSPCLRFPFFIFNRWSVEHMLNTWSFTQSYNLPLPEIRKASAILFLTSWWILKHDKSCLESIHSKQVVLPCSSRLLVLQALDAQAPACLEGGRDRQVVSDNDSRAPSPSFFLLHSLFRFFVFYCVLCVQ